MLDVAGNYPGHRKYEPSNWMCQACGGVVREDQEHLTRCEGYTDLLVIEPFLKAFYAWCLGH